METTLCLETSGQHCSVALAVGEEIFVEHRLLGRAHNEHLLAMLDLTFRRAGIEASAVRLVGFGCGPGSFTGVRIAAAVCQAVALASGARVIALPSSQVLAASIRPPAGPLDWLCVLPSRADQYYLSSYRWQQVDASWLPIVQDCLCAQMPAWSEELLERGGAIVIAGKNPEWLEAQGALILHGEPHAASMVAMVRRGAELGQDVDPERALPMYLQGDSPWIKQG